MRSDDERTTHDTDEQREPRTPGRRAGDRWTRKRIIEIGTIIGLLWGGYSAISAYFAARWATHSEVSDAVRPIGDTLREFRKEVIPRLSRVEARQDSAEVVHQLLIPLARYQCITAERDHSASLTELAGLPCSSLLGRTR